MAPRKPARKKTPSKPLPKGIRITLKGLRSTKDMRAMLHEAIDQIEALGITHLRGSNLYVTACDAKGDPVTRIGRDKIEDIVIDGPYPCAADERGL